MAELRHATGVDLLSRFVHASGSLRDLAEAYGIRSSSRGLRLDRLIDRIQARSGHESESPFERTLRINYLYGRIARPVLKELMQAYREFLRGTA